ncbi:MAG: septum formation protein Maf [Bacteroidales bacterium]|nr:septum formation protein Maf [Bacteroidales bacterium]
MFDNLNKYRIVLASNSPRRQELLRQLGLQFDVEVKRGIDESYPPMLEATQVAEYLACKKAEAYRDDIAAGDIMLITADTVVVCDGAILGKPHDEREAFAMIRKLQNNSHLVVSGVALTTADRRKSFSVETRVSMRPMTDVLIDYYIVNYKPFDKAGAYGIQEWIGLAAIDHIEGSYHNVMGLPTQRLFEELSQF